MTTQTTAQPLSGYNYGAVLLHWVIALLIILQLIGGFTMAHVQSVLGDMRFSVIQWHKTLGILVLALTFARIAWRLMNKPPAHSPMPKIEEFAANFVVLLFYILMLAVPLAGWVMVSASPTAIPTLFMKVQGLVWPNLPVEKSKDLAHNAAYVHMVLAYAFVVLLVLHIGGALKHVIIDHVPEMSRMANNQKLHRKPITRGSSIVAWGIIIVFIGGNLLFGQLHQNAPAATLTATLTTTNADGNWVVDKQASTLGYTMDFSGASKAGKIDDWSANITFDPKDLAKASAHITINSASVSYDDSYVQASISEADGLDTAKFATMDVVLHQFSHLSGDNYTAKATITIRGVNVDVDVPFTFVEKDGKADVKGTASFERLAFGIGKQNDSDGQWIGKTIQIHFNITATHK